MYEVVRKVTSIAKFYNRLLDSHNTFSKVHSDFERLYT